MGDEADAQVRIASPDPEIPILVASDYPAGLAKILQRCPENHVFGIAKIFSLDAAPLHYNNKRFNPQRCNIEALVDLIALASSESVIASEIVSGPKPFSVYSRLAKELQDYPVFLSPMMSSDGAR